MLNQMIHVVTIALYKTDLHKEHSSPTVRLRIGEVYITRSFILCIPPRILFGGQNQEKWDMQACSTYGEKERCIYGFGGSTWGKETTWRAQV